MNLKSVTMAEHHELIAEISVVEKMSTQDRLKHAKKRRNQQLKRFWQYEKQLDKEQSKKSKKSSKKANIQTMNAENKKRNKGKITFVNNIMLLEAAARNDVEEVRLLLKDGVSPDVTNEDGLTALHQCCIDDSEEMMKLLIEFGADVNARDSELWTPLHAAATCGHLHLCKYLIDKGADLLAVNADGNMPYDICEDDNALDYIESEMSKNGVTQDLIDETRLSTERGMLTDLRTIAESGGDLEFRGRYGETPLHVAAANGYTSVAEFLLDNRVSTEKVDDDSWQPVHAAACWGHLQILELLLQHGADLEAKTKTGESALDICEDPDLRQRLMEMREEIESNKATRTSTLTRRRSANTRSSFSGAANMYNSNASLATHFSASVRRTSMREKSALSWKEAREEASFRQGPSDADVEEDGSQSRLNENNHQEEVTLDNQFQNDPQEPIPVTDIDKVTVVISGPSETENQVDRNLGNNKASESKVKKPFVHPPSQSIFMEDVSHNNEDKNENYENKKISNGQMPELPPKSVPTPPSRPAPSTQKPSNSNNVNNKDTPATMPAVNNVKATQNDNSEKPPQIESAVITANDSNDKKSPPLPSGSLFHLKQMRALQLQNKMRSLHSSQTTLNGDSGDSSDISPQSPSSTMLPTSETNGHSPSLTDSRPTSPGSPMLESGDRPKHRFTANSPSEIIGGSDEKNNCCVIL